MVLRNLDVVSHSSEEALQPDTVAPYLENLVPAASSIDIATDSDIEFRITDDVTGVDIANTVIRVRQDYGAWETVYSSSAFQGTYTGTVTDVFSDTKSFDVAFNRNSDFSAGALVEVQVDTRDTATPTANQAVYGANFDVIAAVALDIYPDGVPSEESIPIPMVWYDQDILVDGIDSEEALGDIGVHMHVTDVGGIASAQAFGLPRFAYVISPQGITSQEVLGDPVVTFLITDAGDIASEEAFGDFAATFQLFASGLPSAEIFGTHVIAGPLTLEAGIASEEALGDHVLAGPVIVEAGVESEEALGDATVEHLLVGIGAIGSEEAFGDFTSDYVVSAQGIWSAEAFGLPLLGFDRTISFAGIPSLESFAIHAVQLDGGKFAGVRTGRRGPQTGGQPITILAPGLGMTGAADDFADGVISAARWTVTTSSSSSVRETAGSPRGSLTFNTGRANDAFASVRSTSTHTRFDAAIDIDILAHRVTSEADRTSMFIGAYQNDGTHVRLYIDILKSGARTRLESMSGGLVLRTWFIDAPAITQTQLRMYRVDNRVFIFVGGRQLPPATWVVGAANVEFGVQSFGSLSPILVASVKQYVRNPVVLFGTEPMVTVRAKSPGRVDGFTPTSPIFGEVPVTIETFASQFEVNETYEYIATAQPRQVSFDGRNRLKTASDRIVRT
jgi:hypothetical protein